ncbi:MAG: hypothetical protein ACM37W_22950 [Actinomycetota bacterium]
MTKPDRTTVDIRGLRDRIKAISTLPELADRPMSAILRILVMKGLEFYEVRLEQQEKPVSSQVTIAQLVQNWGSLEQLAKQVSLPIENVKAIATGEPPTDEELMKLGRVLSEYDLEVLLKLRDRTFPHLKEGRSN